LLKPTPRLRERLPPLAPRERPARTHPHAVGDLATVNADPSLETGFPGRPAEFVCVHPRRSGEAYCNQFVNAKFVENLEGHPPLSLDSIRAAVHESAAILDSTVATCTDDVITASDQ
jgi:hypothetical protein